MLHVYDSQIINRDWGLRYGNNCMICAYIEVLCLMTRDVHVRHRWGEVKLLRGNECLT